MKVTLQVRVFNDGQWQHLSSKDLEVSIAGAIASDMWNLPWERICATFVGNALTEAEAKGDFDDDAS